MKNKLLALILILLLTAATVSGCAAGTEAESNEATQEAASSGYEFPEAVLSDDGTTVTVIDQAGREVTLPTEINSIVTNYPIAGNILIALGAVDKIVGVHSSAAESKVYQQLAPQLCELPTIGSTGSMNIESVMALNPDLAIVPVKWSGDISKLDKAGIPYLVINPEGVDLLYETVALLGNATGTADRAREFIGYYEEKRQRMADFAAQNEEKTTVYLASHMDKLTAAGGGMIQSELIELAGGQMVTADSLSSGWSEVSMEQVLEWNPQVIFTVQYANYDDNEFFTDEQWANSDAVVNERVYRIPSYIDEWDTPVPASILGVMWMTSKLYPDVYSTEEMEADALDYYQRFYGLQLTAEELGL